MWSPQQETALKRIGQWVNDPNDRDFYLFGFAGTGKTTIAREVITMTGGNVLFGSFTGKAVDVLRRKGCQPAHTLHSILYRPQGDRPEQLKFDLDRALKEAAECDVESETFKELQSQIKDLQFRLENPQFLYNPAQELEDVRVLVVDECSMIDEKLEEDLKNTGVKLLFMGDPGQLPPVKGRGQLIKETPDVMLDEIHRQVADSPILHLAHAVRSGERLKIGEYGDSKIIPKGSELGELPMEVTQILCGMRKTRDNINRRYRERMGYERQLAEGDRIMCLKNSFREGLFNGQVWNVKEVYHDGDWDPSVWNVECQEEGYDRPRVLLVDFDPDFPGWDYAYGLTVHKAQGSQWKNVLLFDESRVFRGKRAEWLYTGITRAEEEITIVM